MSLAYGLTENGMMTGSGMFEKDEGKARQAAGVQQYSFKFGDNSYSIQRFDPLFKVFGIAADLHDLQQKAKTDGDKAKLASMAVMLMGNITLSSTYMSGASALMQALLEPDRFLTKFLEQYASLAVPKIIGQPVAMVDPYKRQVDGVVESIQSQLPYFRQMLLPTRDVFGNPVKNERLFEVLPSTMTEASQDKVRTEALRLKLHLTDAPKFLLERGPLSNKDRQVKLTDVQQDIYRQVSGGKAMEILAPIVNSPSWDSMPDFAQVNVFKKVFESTHKLAAVQSAPPESAQRVKARQEIIDKIERDITRANGRTTTFNTMGEAMRQSSERRLQFDMMGEPQ
jgi:hypothetical protein